MTRLQLLVIDPQNDFMDIAGAALPVPGASADMGRLADLVDAETGEEVVDPRYVPAQDALERGDIDGAVAEYQKLVADLVNFMTYAAEPGKNARISTGVKVMLYLFLLLGLTYLLKREFWRDVH